MHNTPRPNVLYLVHRFPYPPDKGDRIRNYHVLSWLARRASVHLACLADEDVDDKSVSMLEKLADRVAVVLRGELVQAGTPAELASAPAHDYVAKLVAMAREQGEKLRGLA